MKNPQYTSVPLKWKSASNRYNWKMWPWPWITPQQLTSLRTKSITAPRGQLMVLHLHHLRVFESDEYIIQRPNTSPVLTEAPDMETSLRSVEQTPPSRTENVLSEDKAFDNPEMSGFQTISLEDEGEQLNHNSSSTLQQPYNSTQHMYETVGQRKDPEGSVSDMLRNPYATYASNNGSNFPAQPPLTETPDGGHNGINITDMYAKVSKTINHSVAPVETPPDVMVEEGAPPLPERS
ncbi:uncharacterized protein si:ch73-204p21.2 isoform X2 [Hoplias malabaricus]|uniref:uncharacterized protein si:ch73-204p21.2 isoform X2 n=1 Tax=Hoplias malabaricus TaxID=27720 RepID=UPI0034631AFA